VVAFDHMNQPIIDDSELSRLLLFQGVNPEDIRQWINRCRIQDFATESTLLVPDKENNYMYVLLSGEVSIHLTDNSYPPIACVHEGECVGEMSVFDGKTPSAFVKATKDTRVLAIPRDVLLTMVDYSHGVARNLLYLLSSRLRTGNAVISGSQQLQKEYEQHANVDVLTGLNNRRWINNYFQRIFSRISYQETFPVLSIIMVDVDHFKKFNDSYGHVAGDCALRVVARAMENSIRPSDRIARYGGEEFLVVLSDTNSATAFIVAERIRKGVEEAVIEQNSIRYPGLTVSLGIAQLREDDNLTELVNVADKALYSAKNDGRNRICVSDRTRQ
jgi:diguanylate cyclase (GGDEF)-like protein